LQIPESQVYTQTSNTERRNEVPTVYAVSETAQHNISSALDFGEIVTILPPNAQVAFSVAPTVRRAHRVLETFSDDDYLLFIGDPTAMSIVAVVAAQRNNGRFKCLKWDKRERRYIPIQIDFNNAFKKGEINEFDEHL
jgi:hypothetical protein